MIPAAVYLHILAQYDGRLTMRCQLAVLLAQSGAFGHEWREYLECFCRSESQRIGLPTVPLFKARVRQQLIAERVDRDVAASREWIREQSWISATRAKERYKLRNRDLDNLMHLATANPRYRRGAPMRLYRERDVVRAAYEKYGGAEGLDMARARLRVYNNK